MKILATCIGLATCLTPGPVFSGSGWFPHITTKESGIRSEIILTNDSKNPARLVLYTPEPNRRHLEIIVDPGKTKIVDAQALLDGGAPEAVYASSPEYVQTWLRYDGEGLDTPLMVPPAHEPANVYRFDLPKDSALWYGLALLNVGSDAARIDLKQYGPNRELLYEETMAEALVPQVKLLSAVSRLPFAQVKGSYFEVVSAQPMVAILLSAADDSAGKLQLAQEMPLGRTKNLLRFTEAGGFAPITRIVEISDGLICHSFSLDRHTNLECAKIPPDRLAQLEGLITDLALLDLEVVLFETPQSSCADIPFVQVELYRDGKQNYFEYDLCDLPSRTNSQAVMAFEAEIHDLVATLLDN